MDGLFLGLMSGTSLDGVDAAVLSLEGGGMEILAARTTPLPAPLRASLMALGAPGPADLDALGEADAALGEVLAEAALELLDSAGIPPGRVRAVGSHGQTVRHRPQGRRPFTLQIGDPNRIAQATGITTVADFRRGDLAAGGQGAPLAPAFHAAAFAGRARAVVNIGGMANLTLLEAPVRGWDTGPGNVLMDAWAQRHLGAPMDRDGALAAAAPPHEGLLARLRLHPYFQAPPPKSTGREDFHLEWLDAQLAALGEALSPAQVQSTLCQLTAWAIARALPRGPGRLLVCGGGAHNPQLMARLAALAPGWRVESSARAGMDPDYVEAAAFAWLARQRLAGEAGNLPAVTGARGPRILGAVYAPCPTPAF